MTSVTVGEALGFRRQTSGIAGASPVRQLALVSLEPSRRPRLLESPVAKGTCGQDQGP